MTTSNDRAYQRLAFRIFADFSGTIAVPAVLAALLGKKLDARYGTEPRYLVVCFLAALALTSVAVVKKARFYGKKYQSLNGK
jgi:F0F1-type ATP synthase assembly protein I